jgi:hypothetical protein
MSNKHKAFDSKDESGERTCLICRKTEHNEVKRHRITERGSEHARIRLQNDTTLPGDVGCFQEYSV